MRRNKLAVGSWQLAVGSWQLAVGSWQLAVGSFVLNLQSEIGESVTRIVGSNERKSKVEVVCNTLVQHSVPPGYLAQDHPTPVAATPFRSSFPNSHR
jgi:hypothetical protein